MIPVLYVAESFEVAVCETIFHDVNAKIPDRRVSKVAIYTSAYTQISITRDILLASLRKQDLKRWLVTPNEIIHSLPAQFDQTANWSQEIHSCTVPPTFVESDILPLYSNSIWRK